LIDRHAFIPFSILFCHIGKTLEPVSPAGACHPSGQQAQDIEAATRKEKNLGELVAWGGRKDNTQNGKELASR
jgi:hypothetical protein